MAGQGLAPTRSIPQSTVGRNKQIPDLLVIYLLNQPLFCWPLCSQQGLPWISIQSFQFLNSTEARDLPFHIQLFSGPLDLLPCFTLIPSRTQVFGTTRTHLLSPGSWQRFSHYLSPNLKSGS